MILFPSTMFRVLPWQAGQHGSEVEAFKARPTGRSHENVTPMGPFSGSESGPKTNNTNSGCCRFRAQIVVRFWAPILGRTFRVSECDPTRWHTYTGPLRIAIATPSHNNINASHCKDEVLTTCTLESLRASRATTRSRPTSGKHRFHQVTS